MQSSVGHQLKETKRVRSIASVLQLKTRRKIWLQVHLWLGLALGLLLAIYGITGSILVFHAEIDEWLHPDVLLVKHAETAPYRPLADVVAAGKAAMPAAAVLNFATYPRNPDAAFKFNFNLSGVAGDERWLVGVDPYTATVTGKYLLERSTDSVPATLLGFVFALHYDLLLPPAVGDPVVGLSAALLMISTLTGLIVWWPLTGQWRNALTFKRCAGKVRLNYDLHKISGFYTLLVMLPVLFSGVYMVLPHHVVPVLELFSPATYRYWFESKPPYPNAPAIGMDQAVAIAVQQYPQGRPHWIYGAPNPAQTYTVCQDGVDAPGSLLQRRCTVIDRYSGVILDRDDPSLPTATAGEILTHWQWPLHSGQAFGITGRILVFVTGLACPVLFVTGLIRWLQKRRSAIRPRLTRLPERTAR
ncbi:PepSY-associated TM helix domain-containing protein [Methylomonas sp. UP202]|uniref:PepSY-associated TM helix domain-containing protein n=1 Tax=Methylomonas sp. UP202 TaxID=3040943 RepID=UPI0024798E88|nr:PepSY-associated TM helix domain-containing protein [Methylomonas sp. UP202]WGS87706.1 PepSY-associated TM helix domain-containing protein [Methylomonas sp. UP202]